MEFKGKYSMSKILDWIKKHVWQTVLIGFSLFVLPLIIVHVAYRIPAVSPWFASTWEPGELITYIAGFEAFVGTLILGIVTVNLNKKSVELNRELILIEKTRSLYDRKPKLKIEAEEMTPITIGELFDKDIPYYSYSNLQETRSTVSSGLSQQVYLQKIKILPSLDCDLQANVMKLELTIFDIGDQDTIIEYDKEPELFFPDYFHVRDEPYEFAFIHGNLIPTAHNVILGHLCLRLTNNVLDRFLLSIRFRLYTDYTDNTLVASSLEINDYYITPEQKND